MVTSLWNMEYFVSLEVFKNNFIEINLIKCSKIYIWWNKTLNTQVKLSFVRFYLISWTTICAINPTIRTNVITPEMLNFIKPLRLLRVTQTAWCNIIPFIRLSPFTAELEVSSWSNERQLSRVWIAHIHPLPATFLKFAHIVALHVPKKVKNLLNQHK